VRATLRNISRGQPVTRSTISGVYRAKWRFTIWKTQKGFTVGESDVRSLLEHGEATLVDGPQPARLVMAEGNVPQIVGLDGAPLEDLQSALDQRHGLA